MPHIEVRLDAHLSMCYYLSTSNMTVLAAAAEVRQKCHCKERDTFLGDWLCPGASSYQEASMKSLGRRVQIQWLRHTATPGWKESPTSQAASPEHGGCGCLSGSSLVSRHRDHTRLSRDNQCLSLNVPKSPLQPEVTIPNTGHPRGSPGAAPPPHPSTGALLSCPGRSPALLPGERPPRGPTPAGRIGSGIPTLHRPGRSRSQPGADPGQLRGSGAGRAGRGSPGRPGERALLEPEPAEPSPPRAASCPGALGSRWAAAPLSAMEKYKGEGKGRHACP